MTISRGPIIALNERLSVLLSLRVIEKENSPTNAVPTRVDIDDEGEDKLPVRRGGEPEGKAQGDTLQIAALLTFFIPPRRQLTVNAPSQR